MTDCTTISPGRRRDVKPEHHPSWTADVHGCYEAAARAVMYLRGVTAVANTIALPSTAPVTAVKTAIETPMLRNAPLDARDITVEVNGGEVMLGGAVGSFAERREAEYVAWSAAGVTSVENRLTVTPEPMPHRLMRHER